MLNKQINSKNETTVPHCPSLFYTIVFFSQKNIEREFHVASVQFISQQVNPQRCRNKTQKLMNYTRLRKSKICNSS